MESSGLQRSFLLAALLVTCLAVALDAAAVRTRRDVDESTNENHVKMCHASTPCGWAVYVPYTRRVDYFMKNTCECPKGKTCTRTDDDLSVSAYVYRCRDA
ncbi:uncharacterized protein LOC126356328 [Schistocerca gregaria]|uniref:uncharacterized protein LOC126356328 n=1 Tax=Schistocerca gregaria TaxID=7010 RepID=UPI00211F1095|nr:uncharacterized protein LOC126356328 [Schistocerca gregaria]